MPSNKGIFKDGKWVWAWQQIDPKCIKPAPKKKAAADPWGKLMLPTIQRPQMMDHSIKISSLKDELTESSRKLGLSVHAPETVFYPLTFKQVEYPKKWCSC
eukprot:NODE_3800_length_521_cov_275.980932_g3234_i0.p1 GENE.NODE_3800_length_521_cov_275.980932_g3234_i0~~NODE_3800_length_521_cov_275.980932_g3234_i0.p1  ORF type:complete len:101 (+),score=19.64 NODE_3800_length_521_cov_275.980932_g3234_i0:63-365(+)